MWQETPQDSVRCASETHKKYATVTASWEMGIIRWSIVVVSSKVPIKQGDTSLNVGFTIGATDTYL